ncbi:hypothetical protein GCM10010124_22120 [Pilimelia terevasa]|uniref:Methyltransferase domain-containing protein n=1 Tax=Pilimelia terevasa TaxID=53372 RepID=A0A8J3FIA1_9ACTN|nr:class I SAM-dependent methyltransferase [Pilimelia terevasa]GGK28923.1 hypothetical protein GCM10010124_22120 [Pilimelia terevasa]
MTTTSTASPAGLALTPLKSTQQQTWASGDFRRIAARIVLVSELLADTADLRAGSRVLDVACGNGNATLAAARADASVLGVDYVEALLEDGRRRAAAEGLSVEFRLGDAEALPVADDAVDAALSVFGVMFAPDHQRAAAELVRVVRPGGTLGLASWCPDGFIGAVFRTVAGHVPPPAGVASPLLWGTAAHLAELFGDAVAETASVTRTCTMRFASAEAFVDTFRRWYGPTVRAFGALDEAGAAALAAELTALARQWDRHGGEGPVALPSTYLESVLTLR